jgi:hypothetical protein
MLFINISLVIHVRIRSSTQCCIVRRNIWIETLNLVPLILYFWCWKPLMICGDDYSCNCTFTGCSRDLGKNANINLLLIGYLTMLQNFEIPWHFLASCSMSWIVSLAPFFFFLFQFSLWVSSRCIHIFSLPIHPHTWSKNRTYIWKKLKSFKTIISIIISFFLL